MEKRQKRSRQPMKRSTKIALIIVCICVIAFDVLIIASSRGSSATTSSTSVSNATISGTTSSKQTSATATPEQKALTSSAKTSSPSTSKGKVVYEDSSLKVTFLGVSEQAGFIYVNTRLDNKTDNDMTVYPTDTSINGTMVQLGSGVPPKMTGRKNLVQAWIVLNAKSAGISKASDVKTIETKFQYPDVGENTTPAITINVSQ